MVRFQGSVPLALGVAVEIRLDGVRGLFPPLMVLAEVAGSRERSPNLHEISGLIKGIVTL
mgnify:CR=1 FL=1